MTQKQSSDLTKYILDPIGFTDRISKPIGNLIAGVNPALEKSRELAATAAATAKNTETGDNVLRAALGGLGLGLSGTRLYRLLQSSNKAKDNHMKFGPGAKTLDEREKIALDLADTLRQFYANAAQGVGQAVNAVHPSAMPAAVLGASGLGLYGGAQIINAIEDKKQKEDQDDMVEEAKKEYQRALMGKKHAAAFEAAFNAFVEKRSEWTAADIARAPLDLLSGVGHRIGIGDLAASAYATGTLGAGALAGKMTYDWTRARSKDKALEKARKSRARIEGAAPLYIDPEQLAAIKKLAD